jgi:hypothetical protein
MFLRQAVRRVRSYNRARLIRILRGAIFEAPLASVDTAYLLVVPKRVGLRPGFPAFTFSISSPLAISRRPELGYRLRLFIFSKLPAWTVQYH